MRSPSPTLLLGSNLPNWYGRIKELSCSGKWQELASHYCEMNNVGVRPTDPSIFPSIVKACSSLSFRHGEIIHASLIKQGFESLTSVGNSIMDLYTKHGHLDSAVRIFDGIRSQDSVSWNILIYGYLNKGASRDGLWCFNQARVAGFEPNVSTLVLVIQACCHLNATVQGHKLHGYMIKSGFWGFPSVQNSLLSIYVNDNMECARKLFVEMRDQDVISWSLMIKGYMQIEEPGICLQIFQEMVSRMIEPDGVIAVSVLKACASLRNISMGRLLHGLVIRRGLDCDLFVGNSLIDMYSKCTVMDAAFKIFNDMPLKNTVTWNSILSGFVLNEKYSEALTLFRSMEKEARDVDEVTLVSILQICKFFVLPIHCKSVHGVIIRRQFDLNKLLLNSLIDTYANCYLVDHASNLFHRMNIRDVVLWSTMIAGFTHCGKPDEAIAVFQQLNQAQVNPNAITIINLLEACTLSADLNWSKCAHGIAIRRGFEAEVAVGTAIVDMYSKCGALHPSRKAFDRIPCKNIISWSAMIAAYGMHGLAREALALLREMKQAGLKPNSVTALSVLSACSHGGLIQEGLSFFATMIQDHGIVPGLEHYSCVVDMLARAGRLDSALSIIEKMPEAGSSVWGAFLSACRTYENIELGAAAARHVLDLDPLDSNGYLLTMGLYAMGGFWNDAAKMRKLVKAKGVRVVSGYSLVCVGDKACRFVAGDESHPEINKIHVMIKWLHNPMKVDESYNLSMIEEYILTRKEQKGASEVHSTQDQHRMQICLTNNFESMVNFGQNAFLLQLCNSY